MAVKKGCGRGLMTWEREKTRRKKRRKEREGIREKRVQSVERNSSKKGEKRTHTVDPR